MLRLHRVPRAPAAPSFASASLRSPSTRTARPMSPSAECAGERWQEGFWRGAASPDSSLGWLRLRCRPPFKSLDVYARQTSKSRRVARVITPPRGVVHPRARGVPGVRASPRITEPNWRRHCPLRRFRATGEPERRIGARIGGAPRRTKRGSLPRVIACPAKSRVGRRLVQPAERFPGPPHPRADYVGAGKAVTDPNLGNTSDRLLFAC
jgi:hypothetical protein